MALGEAGGVYPAVTMVSYGGRRHAVLPKKGPAKGSFKVRGGRKQSLYVTRSSRSRRRK